MKKTVFGIMSLCIIVIFTACGEGDNYGDICGFLNSDLTKCTTEEEVKNLDIRREDNYSDMNSTAITSEEELNSFIADVQQQKYPLTYESQFIEKLQQPIDFDNYWIVIYSTAGGEDRNKRTEQPFMFEEKIYIKMVRDDADGGNNLTVSLGFAFMVSKEFDEVIIEDFHEYVKRFYKDGTVE